MPESNIPARLMVVDDDPCLLRLLELRLKNAGYEVDAAPNSEQALASLAVRPPDLLITDVKMDGMDGMALFQRVRAQHPTVPVIMHTAHGSVNLAVEATQAGAFGFLTKPCGSAELLGKVAEALAHSGRTPAGVAGGGEDGWCAGFHTRNPELNGVLNDLRRVAATDAGVLLSGETGTGKGTLARAIHRASPRAEGPFVSVNCGSMPEPVLADELFGGPAADGDVGDHPGGLLGTAAGGTLYLEDVERLPELLQVRLLRALEGRAPGRRAGGEAPAADVRVIATTRESLNLEQAVAEGEFREDLYYRLNGLKFDIPPLRERPEDVALLAEQFLRRAATRSGATSAKALSRDAMRLLQQAAWPGNVRQLRNVIVELSALAPSDVISAELVARALRDGSRPFVTLNEARGAFERDYLVRLLRAVNANVTEAARIAGRNRTEFYRLLQRHHLEPRDFRTVN